MPLLLALAAEASAGSAGWAAVGLPGLGPRAAADAGLELGAGLWIDSPGRSWPQVLATVLEAVPVVLVGHLPVAPDRVLRRLSAIMRRSGAVLLAAGAWDGADVRLQVTSATWDGVGEGFGLLRGRRVTVLSTGRGAAVRARRTDLWLPGPDGRVSPVIAATDTATDRMPDSAGVGRPVLRVLG
ncbi:hypothetical protein ACFRR6_24410 [Streptomyces sp. NPDC056891]|uniref:hypothetical protein n=1 Tax=Streptomyces sp. NPDC056891 TaxID=3345961 RepID=UPI0036905E93